TPVPKEEQPVPDVQPVVAASVPERILEYCRTPRSKEEIAAHLEIRAVYYVVSKYLKPLVASGKLQLTIPEKPGSRNQKYQTVSD
ncbi:MAG: AAA family ATPase, partial [Clostridia bacterium]|nr:AAA family ATPase [Clostridia bacterium]